MLSFHAVISAHAYAWNYPLHPLTSSDAHQQPSLIRTGLSFMFVLVSAERALCLMLLGKARLHWSPSHVDRAVEIRLESSLPVT